MPGISLELQFQYHLSYFDWCTVKPLDISHTLVGNEIVDHWDIIGASPVGAAPNTSSFLTWTPGFFFFFLNSYITVCIIHLLAEFELLSNGQLQIFCLLRHEVELRNKTRRMDAFFIVAEFSW